MVREDNPPIVARFGLVVIIALLSTFVAWASIAHVEEIARGDGKIIPVSRTQLVQSSEPGVVSEIAVTVGQVVNKGDLLVRLDNTTTASALGESEARSRALRAQLARLEVEIADGADSEFACPDDIMRQSPEICENETSLFRARRANARNKLAVLRARQTQRERELDEALASIARLEENLKIARSEEKLLAPLVSRALVAQTDLLRVQREIADQDGQLQTTKQSVERLQAAINEAALQVEELGLQIQQEALSQKTEALAELAVIDETIRGASDRVRRTDIRSPVDGIVNTLEATTIGGYVQPGSLIAAVVPTSDTLLIEARLSPRDVAFVRKGQAALVKVTAFDFSVFGGLDGVVETVSADSIVDPESGEVFYNVRVRTGRSELRRGEELHSIIPGMVASVDIMTGEKTILDYLLKPINKARSDALRER